MRGVSVGEERPGDVVVSGDGLVAEETASLCWLHMVSPLRCLLKICATPRADCFAGADAADELVAHSGCTRSLSRSRERL